MKETGTETSDVLVCAECTGQYIWPLCCVCKDLGIDLRLENPAQIKHSSGVQRGKNDRLDARKIAAYAFRFSRQSPFVQSAAGEHYKFATAYRRTRHSTKQHKRLCTAEGIGDKTAVKMIVVTKGFTDFTDARHAGVVPFSYSSGSSIRSRNKVSQRADKSIKALLHMAALVVATRCKGGTAGVL
ncbi:Transposase IS116/IS110/IS902 family protein [Bacteroidales bacterium Barb6XT]|nr:Transposase IS116/IS110/IS902 family protein [Bacteroidales bacterium Barb6XT]